MSAISLLALAAAGCGSASPEELPPAAGPARSPALETAPAGRLLPLGSIPAVTVADGATATVAAARGRAFVVLSTRERVVELFDTRTLRRLGRAPAGVGPTRVVSDGGGTVYVVDTAGDALLVYRLRPKLEPIRRYALLGAPYGVAFDPRRRRLWVTLTRTNEVVELAAGTRPHELARFPTPRQPDTVAVEPRTGRVFVTGSADGVVQRLAAPRE